MVTLKAKDERYHVAILGHWAVVEIIIHQGDLITGSMLQILFACHVAHSISRCICICMLVTASQSEVAISV